MQSNKVYIVNLIQPDEKEGKFVLTVCEEGDTPSELEGE
jgi:hypothetical protein